MTGWLGAPLPLPPPPPPKGLASSCVLSVAALMALDRSRAATLRFLDGGSVPNPSDYTGQPGLISRSSPNHRLGWTAADDIQGTPRYLSWEADNIDKFLEIDLIGLTGSGGSGGATGLQGFTGAQGTAGLQGYTGVQGVTGPGVGNTIEGSLVVTGFTGISLYTAELSYSDLTFNGKSVLAPRTASGLIVWAPATKYYAGNMVYYRNLLFQVLTNHTSSSTFAVDLPFWTSIDPQARVRQKIAHGLAVYSPIYMTNSSFNPACANNPNTLGTHVIIESSTNHVLAVYEGDFYAPGHGLLGINYVSPYTSGTLVNDPPDMYAYFVNTVIIVESPDWFSVVANQPAYTKQ